MTAISLSTSVNKHYLNKVMALTDVMDVAASEDIFDTRGMKLVAKGTRLSRSQQDTLGLHKLKKTLESTLSADGGADTDQVVTSARRILEASVPMSRILSTVAGNGASPLAILQNIKFGHAMRMMLTLIDRDGPQALDHSVTVSLLSICMAKKLHLTPDEQMAAGLAGLLHDIGELYIDPSYLAPGKRLLPHEWAHLVIHPRIGQMLISELESYPVSVARAVAEHHERFDGTGYPRQQAGSQLSAPGQAVAVAEMIAGVLHKDFPLERAELALKIVPGEHAHHLLSAISGALRGQSSQQPARAVGSDDDGVESLFHRIAATLDAVRSLAAGNSAKSPRIQELLTRTLERIRAIERAFISTGLDIYLRDEHVLHGAGDDDSAIMFEKVVATREIAWRLRDIARDLALQTIASPDEQTLFAALISLLDGDQAPVAASNLATQAHSSENPANVQRAA